jgi:hypothetical protein
MKEFSLKEQIIIYNCSSKNKIKIESLDNVTDNSTNYIFIYQQVRYLIVEKNNYYHVYCNFFNFEIITSNFVELLEKINTLNKNYLKPTKIKNYKNI